MRDCLTLIRQYLIVLFFVYTSTICQEDQAEEDCKHRPVLPLNATVPIELYSLPISYAAASLPADPYLQMQIQNTLALYPLAIDGKNFAELNRVFDSDVVANYSAPLNVITGVLNLQAVLNASLFYVTTQHSLATQAIEVLEESCEAKSVTYFTATHFGQGDYFGQALYAHGQYQDTWVRKDGEWRVKLRNLVFMGPLIGNSSIFAPTHGS